METSDVRKRIKDTIERARRGGAQRRARTAEASAAYEAFLATAAVPVFHQVANVLKIEGYLFTVHTPMSSVRLASDKSGEDFIELRLDTYGPLPQVVAHVERVKGREKLIEDRPLKPGTPVDELSDQDVLDMLSESLTPFIER
jgi:hypothetical protein